MNIVLRIRNDGAVSNLFLLCSLSICGCARLFHFRPEVSAQTLCIIWCGFKSDEIDAVSQACVCGLMPNSKCQCFVFILRHSIHHCGPSGWAVCAWERTRCHSIRSRAFPNGKTKPRLCVILAINLFLALLLRSHSMDLRAGTHLLIVECVLRNFLRRTDYHENVIRPDQKAIKKKNYYYFHQHPIFEGQQANTSDMEPAGLRVEHHFCHSIRAHSQQGFCVVCTTEFPFQNANIAHISSFSNWRNDWPVIIYRFAFTEASFQSPLNGIFFRFRRNIAVVLTLPLITFRAHFSVNTFSLLIPLPSFPAISIYQCFRVDCSPATIQVRILFESLISVVDCDFVSFRCLYFVLRVHCKCN